MPDVLLGLTKSNVLGSRFNSGICGVLRAGCPDVSESIETIEEGDPIFAFCSRSMSVTACNVSAWSHFKQSCCSSSLDKSKTEDVHDKLSCSLSGFKVSSGFLVGFSLGNLNFCGFFFLFGFLACG